MQLITKKIINLKFILYKVENRPIGTVFFIIFGFLSVLSFSGVPSTPTFAQNGFYIKICSLLRIGIFCVDQKPHDKYYKEIINLKFDFF